VIRYRIWLRSARRQPRTSRSALVQYANHSATEQPEYSSSQLAPPLREHTCHMESHSVACHPAEVTFPPYPSRSWYSIKRPRRDARRWPLLAGSISASEWCPSVRPSVCLSRRPKLHRLPTADRYLPSLKSSSGQRLTLRSEGRGSTQTCIQSASARVSKGRYDTIPELSMGPFCVTRSNLTNQLTDLTQPTTSEKKLWTQPDRTQCN